MKTVIRFFYFIILLMNLNCLLKGFDKTVSKKRHVKPPKQRNLMLNMQPITYTANEDDLTAAELFDNSSVLHTTDLEDTDELAGLTGETPVSSEALMQRIDAENSLGAQSGGFKDIDETAVTKAVPQRTLPLTVQDNTPQTNQVQNSQNPNDKRELISMGAVGGGLAAGAGALMALKFILPNQDAILKKLSIQEKLAENDFNIKKAHFGAELRDVQSKMASLSSKSRNFAETLKSMINDLDVWAQGHVSMMNLA